MSDVSFGKMKSWAIPRWEIWGQTPPFPSLFWRKRKGNSRAAPKEEGKTPRFPLTMTLEGCGRREPALPKGATKGVGTPLRGGRGASFVPIRAEGAWGCGRRGPRPVLGRLSGTPSDAAACNGRAAPALLPYGQVLLGFATFAVKANEMPLPSPCPGMSGSALPRRRAARGAPGAAARPREETAGVRPERGAAPPCPRRHRPLHGRLSLCCRRRPSLLSHGSFGAQWLLCPGAGRAAR